MTGSGLTRQAALEMHKAQRLLAAEVVSCQACAHGWMAHYDAGGRGCAACDSAGRACPAYVPGGLPHQVTKHLDPLGTDPAPCPWLCGHPAGGHAGGGDGCPACGCRYGDPDAAAPGGIAYHGYPSGDYRGHRLVVVEAPAGTPVTLLPEISRHSPAGFAWGYGGSGPAALARSLLVSVLGPAAACPSCRGHRKIAWDPAAGTMVPAWDLSDGLGTEVDCPDCDDGFRDLPYQDFKFAVIAALPGGGEWVLSRADILRWLAAADPASCAAALAVLPEAG